MTTLRKPQLLKLLAALFAVSLAAAACGSDSETTTTSECGSSLEVEKGDSVTDLSVALVAPSAKDDVAFTQSMVDSLTRLGIEPQITDGTFVVEEAAAAIRGYAEDGVEIVIAHGTQYGGSLAELRHTRHLILHQDTDDNNDYAPPVLLRAKLALDASSAGKWQRQTDIFDDPDRLLLCKLLILYHHGPTRHEMLKDEILNPILNDPSFVGLAYSDSIPGLSQSGKPRKLYHNPEISSFLSNSGRSNAYANLTPGHIDAFVTESVN